MAHWVGRWSSTPSGSFIHIPVILAEISKRPQQKWTSGLSQRPLSGGCANGGTPGSPNYPSTKEHVCAPHGTPQGLFTALSQFYSHTRPHMTLPHMTLPQPPSSTSSQSSHPSLTLSWSIGLLLLFLQREKVSLSSGCAEVGQDHRTLFA